MGLGSPQGAEDDTWQPIHKACREGSILDVQQQLLLEAAKLDSAAAGGGGGAGGSEEQLVRSMPSFSGVAGAVSRPTAYGWTALHVASDAARHDVVALLLSLLESSAAGGGGGGSDASRLRGILHILDMKTFSGESALSLAADAQARALLSTLSDAPPQPQIPSGYFAAAAAESRASSPPPSLPAAAALAAESATAALSLLKTYRAEKESSLRTTLDVVQDPSPAASNDGCVHGVVVVRNDGDDNNGSSGRGGDDDASDDPDSDVASSATDSVGARTGGSLSSPSALVPSPPPAHRAVDRLLSGLAARQYPAGEAQVPDAAVWARDGDDSDRRMRGAKLSSGVLRHVLTAEGSAISVLKSDMLLWRQRARQLASSNRRAQERATALEKEVLQLKASQQAAAAASAQSSSQGPPPSHFPPPPRPFTSSSSTAAFAAPTSPPTSAAASGPARSPTLHTRRASFVGRARAPPDSTPHATSASHAPHRRGSGRAPPAGILAHRRPTPPHPSFSTSSPVPLPPSAASSFPLPSTPPCSQPPLFPGGAGGDGCPRQRARRTSALPSARRASVGPASLLPSQQKRRLRRRSTIKAAPRPRGSTAGAAAEPPPPPPPPPPSPPPQVTLQAAADALAAAALCALVCACGQAADEADAASPKRRLVSFYEGFHAQVQRSRSVGAQQVGFGVEAGGSGVRERRSSMRVVGPAAAVAASMWRRKSASGHGSIDAQTRRRSMPPSFCSAPVLAEEQSDSPLADEMEMPSGVHHHPPTPLDNVSRRWSLIFTEDRRDSTSSLQAPSVLRRSSDVAAHLLT